MSFDVDDPQDSQSIQELLTDLILWQRVTAYLLAQMAGADENEIYEDLE